MHIVSPFEKAPVASNQIRILLITNCDWDNVGDQVIEACDISLITAAASELGVPQSSLTISSQPLEIIPAKYCTDRDERLLQQAYDEIGACTLVLFGGSPVFNYAYQDFYIRTIKILSIARELKKPVLFSAVGIDSYDEGEKCQLLKQAVHNGTVKQITTRDGIEQLARYMDASPTDGISNDGIPFSLVSDPAVFSQTVFSNHLTSSKMPNSIKKIGIFVFRAGGFAANGFKFSRKQQCVFWHDLCEALDRKGYDYELVTSGHFADEAMLRYMIDEGYLEESKCVLQLNTPEDLLKKISSYSGIISCRLHPSIIAFSCNVPSVGLIWNQKIQDFYRHIGYPERSLHLNSILSEDRITTDVLIQALENAMDQGVEKDPTYLSSIYTSLLKGIALCLEKDDAVLATQPSYTQILNALPKYSDTSSTALNKKIENKLTRIYRGYNDSQMEIVQLKKMMNARPQQSTFRLIYHSGGHPACFIPQAISNYSGSLETLQSNNLEYQLDGVFPNDGTTVLAPNCYARDSYLFKGWRLRCRSKGTWYWLLNSKDLLLKDASSSAPSDFAHIFKPSEHLPIVPLSQIDVIVAEAVWMPSTINVFYNSGLTSQIGAAHYPKHKTTTLPSGSSEVSLNCPVNELITEGVLKNGFSYAQMEFTGWRMRVKNRGTWYWLLSNNSLLKVEGSKPKTIGCLEIIPDCGIVPFEALENASAVAFEATWRSIPEPEATGIKRTISNILGKR